MDVVRCRKNGLANTRFPLPVFCPLDSVPREGHLADLTYVKLRKDGRVALLARLPYVGEGWYAKPACAHMLEAGIVEPGCHRPRGPELPCVGAAQDGGGLARGAPDQAERQCVDRAVGAQCDLVCTSNNQLDGHGCQYRQTFVDAAGQTHCNHIFVTQLFNNASHRPAWDFVLAAEYCAVARIRQMLAEVPVRYLKFLKTDGFAQEVLAGGGAAHAPVSRGRHAGGGGYPDTERHAGVGGAAALRDAPKPAAAARVIRIDTDSDSAPRAQPAPRVRARAARQRQRDRANPAAARAPGSAVRAAATATPWPRSPHSIR